MSEDDIDPDDGQAVDGTPIFARQADGMLEETAIHNKPFA